MLFPHFKIEIDVLGESIKLKRRIITGLSLGGVAIGAIFVSGPLLLMIVMITAMVALNEFNDMWDQTKQSFSRFLGYVTIGVLYFSGFFPELHGLWFTWLFKGLVITILCIMGVELLYRRPIVVKDGLLTSLRGSLCIGIPLFFVFLVRTSDFGIYCIYYLLFCIYLGDTAALFVGKGMGKIPLSALSPNKTYEGAMAHVITCIGVSYIFIEYIFPIAFVYTLPQFLLFGVIVSILAQLGDLHESLIKRHCNVKDSSDILPGHGGVYDRIDSVLLTLPIMFYILYG